MGFEVCDLSGLSGLYLPPPSGTFGVASGLESKRVMHSMRALGILSGLVSADASLGGHCQSPGSLGDGPSPLTQSFTFTSFLAPNSQLGYGVGAPQSSELS